MRIQEYADRDMLAIDMANIIAGELKGALMTHDHVSLAVPGGSTPGPIFDALCAAELDWDRVRIVPTDERWVPETNERSNARQIRQRLMVHRAAAATLVPLYSDGGPPEEMVPQLAESLAEDLPISVLVLGMGADMHTASLFPGAPGLADALAPNAPVLSLLHPETQPEPRVSLSAWVLNGALSKHLVIYGAEKRAAFERAMTLPPEEAPIQAVSSVITVHWAE
ncbi:6-phosphogluconolactonase [Arenibacterium sp. CAU 1754]